MLSAVPNPGTEAATNEEIAQDMTRAASTNPGPEFHAFLFAVIGEDRNGMPLSVISALARMDIDPWQEAAVLAKLPEGEMADRMVALFRAVPDQTLSDRDRGAMAKRLSALLPRPSTADFTVSTASSNDEAQSRYGALLFSLFIFALMATQLVMARMEPRTQVNPSPATAIVATPAPPAPAPATSGQ